MRVAVVDIGTNSTRLLIADVVPGGPDRGGAHAEEIVRHSHVTRLGERVDETGALADGAVARTLAVLARYRQEIDESGCRRDLAVLTSAVRDSSNGDAFLARVRGELGLDAHVLSGDEEARLMFAGAMADRGEARRAAGDGATVVIDIGGGSTEVVIGSGLEPTFHASLQAGVVRMTERHLHHDPPAPDELDRLARDARTVIADGTAAAPSEEIREGIAVAGTATSAAAIAQELDPYDPARVHGYPLTLETVARLAERLAAMDEAQRRRVIGLHPDRAPTIVAGTILLREAMRAFGLTAVEVSEHDLLLGGALSLASDRRPEPAA